MILGRARSIRLFGPIPVLLFFIADADILQSLKPQLKDNTSVGWRSVPHGILCKPGSLR